QAIGAYAHHGSDGAAERGGRLASALPLTLEEGTIQMGMLPREHLGQGFPPRGVRAAPRALGTGAVRAGRHQEGQAAEERGTLPRSWHARGRRWGPRAALGWCVQTSRRWSGGPGWHAFVLSIMYF